MHRLCKGERQLEATEQPKKKKGVHPRNFDERGIRTLIHSITKLRRKNVNFTIKQAAGISHLASRRTFSRYLNEQGYKFLQTRKKGLLNAKDRRMRLQYARKMKRQLKERPDFWMKDDPFYLDGVSFVYKTNPLSTATQPAKTFVFAPKIRGASRAELFVALIHRPRSYKSHNNKHA